MARQMDRQESHGLEGSHMSVVRLLLTEREAAARLSFSPSKLKGLRQSGKIGYVACGRLVRYTPEILSAYIAAQEVRGG